MSHIISGDYLTDNMKRLICGEMAQAVEVLCEEHVPKGMTFGVMSLMRYDAPSKYEGIHVILYYKDMYIAEKYSWRNSEIDMIGHIKRLVSQIKETVDTES